MKAWILKVLLIVLLSTFLPYNFSNASIVDDLLSKITTTTNEVQKLEKEIKEYENKVQKTKKEATTLISTVKELEYTEKKLETSIAVTGKKITTTKLNIERLGIEIATTIEEINGNKDAIKETLLQLQDADNNSLVEVFFTHDTLSDFWGIINSLESIQKSITIEVGKLERNKAVLEDASLEAENYKTNLLNLKEEYADKKEVTKITKNEKSSLLTKTKNQQVEYERMLKERIEKKRLFEEELSAYENQLREALDKTLLPTPGAGVLAWPLKSFVITQYFGNTPFATKNPSIYSGKGHNGIDLGVGMGTTLYSAREGVVLGTGDTDATCPNASYGKWVLIQHDNGLSTLYAHLSLIRATSGESVTTDSVIGYTGNTGYSTGPHLHFTVFASDSVKISSLSSRACNGATYVIPLLTKTGGYLNPLSYLPAL